MPDGVGARVLPYVFDSSRVGESSVLGGLSGMAGGGEGGLGVLNWAAARACNLAILGSVLF